MDHTRNRGGNRHWNNRRGQDRREKKVELTPEEIANQEAIKAMKQKMPECPMCHQPITELVTALADKESGEPVHFDCVLEKIQSEEKLVPGQKITYIGQGRFAVVTFPNVHDTRNFTIERIIEWEERDKKFEWRSEIAGLYSQVH